MTKRAWPLLLLLILVVVAQSTIYTTAAPPSHFVVILDWQQSANQVTLPSPTHINSTCKPLLVDFGKITFVQKLGGKQKSTSYSAMAHH